jgi:phospholipase/lecithinase/hemolysin
MKSFRANTVRRLGALLVAVIISTAGHASGVDHVVIFGDSLSDNGNLLAQTGGVFPTNPAYFSGRQTNGLVWGEVLAFDIGASLSNFAIAGAQTGTTNVWDNGPFPGGPTYGGLQDQIADYTGGATDPGALHIVWAGANNFLSIPSDPTAAVTQAVTDIVNSVGALKVAGIPESKILLINLPDLGLTPRLIDAGLSAQGSFLTDQFNMGLLGGLGQAGFTDVTVIDSAQILRDVVADPGAFGFTNWTDACIDPVDPLGPGSCLTDWMKDPDEYLFWDDIHPTRAGHAIFADVIRTTAWVPIPASVWLFGSALIVLGWVRKRAA